MATNVLMPKWGMTMKEGTVGSWLKQEGDAVSAGEEIVEIESEKAVNLVEAAASGVLARILVQEGETVPVTSVIAIIADAEEDVTATTTESPATPSVATDDVPTVPVPKRREKRKRVPTSPAARRLARENNVDLNDIVGSGPDGMIVVEDVQSFINQSQSPTDTVSSSSAIERMSFYSDGHRIDACLYRPESRSQTAPITILCLGYTYTKDLLVGDLAKRLTQLGHAALIFDYRGFGASEGKQRVIPAEQVTDIRAAVSFVSGLDGVDSANIGLLGISLGGSHALTAAAADRRVSRVATIAPIGDCRRWMKGQRRQWEWAEFLAMVDAGECERSITGRGDDHDAWEFVVPDPQSRRFLDALLAEFPALRCRLSTDTASSLLAYRPEQSIHQIGPRPILLIHGDDDQLVPIEESQSIAAHAQGPCDLVSLSGIDHFNWATPGSSRFSKVVDTLLAWYQPTSD